MSHVQDPQRLSSATEPAVGLDAADVLFVLSHILKLRVQVVGQLVEVDAGNVVDLR